VSRALQPVPAPEIQRMAARLVQAVRSQWTNDEIAELVNEYLARMLDGRERLGSVAEMRAFTTSAVGMWTMLAQIAAELGQADGQADLKLYGLALPFAG
jgi:hypothetical protein